MRGDMVLGGRIWPRRWLSAALASDAHRAVAHPNRFGARDALGRVWPRRRGGVTEARGSRRAVVHQICRLVVLGGRIWPRRRLPATLAWSTHRADAHQAGLTAVSFLHGHAWPWRRGKTAHSTAHTETQIRALPLPTWQER